MTKDQKIICAKAGLLELAKQLGNVAKPARSWATAGTASTGSRISTTKAGELALKELSRHKPILQNRVAPEIEGIARAAVVALEHDQRVVA